MMWGDTVDGRNPANQFIGSLSHYLQGFIHPRWLFEGISEPSKVSSQIVVHRMECHQSFFHLSHVGETSNSDIRWLRIRRIFCWTTWFLLYVSQHFLGLQCSIKMKAGEKPLGQPWLPIWGKPSWQLKGHITTFTSYLRRKRLTFLLELRWQETMPRKEASSSALGVTSNMSFSFASHGWNHVSTAELRMWNDDRGVSEPRFQLPAAIVFCV